ncbi:MAG TPA: thiol-disulfide isomerase [Blastocatellia bacterium]|nr:thiol-disulfide isomerase [Blastocatellia bacterium]
MKRMIVFFATVAFVVGIDCGINRRSSAAADGASTGSREVTFNRDIAPIFFKDCAGCHRPGELAPMSLLTFKDARPWARSIRDKVATRQMPPWGADPHYGQFTNDRRLSQHEVDTIVAWVDQGAKEGNARDLPATPSFDDRWVIGKPDQIVTMDKDYELGAEGSDEYVNITVPTNFTEDKWVQAMEVHPGNKRIVHHAVVFVQPPALAANAKRIAMLYRRNSIFYSDGTLRRVKLDAPAYDDGCTAPFGGYAPGSGVEGLGMLLGFYAPGKDVDSWPAGTAKLIPAGSNIILQMHYSRTTGKPEKDQTSVGFVFAKQPPDKQVMSIGAVNFYFKIPPGDPEHQVTGCYTVGRDVDMLAYFPHMHLRGKSMTYEALFPDGHRQTLIDVPEYNFNWQTLYKLKEPVFLPKGTKVLVTAHFDNSEKNKYNPDPRKAVRFGDPTYDEMMVGYFDFISAGPPQSALKLDDRLLDSYTGIYQVAPGLDFTVSRNGKKLKIVALGGLTFDLRPESESQFTLDGFDASMTFVRDGDGTATEVVFQFNTVTMHARRAPGGPRAGAGNVR